VTRERRDDDEGRIALLSLVFALVAVLLVLTVVSASAVHLQRKRLFAVADAAAADAADAVDERSYYGGSGGVAGDGSVPLTDAGVRASVATYLADADPRLTELAVASGTGSPDGRTAQVVLTARLVPPFAAFVPGPFAQGVRAQVTSRATALLR